MSVYANRIRVVYFIRPVGMQGPVKIGCALSPDGRRTTLETWSPFALEIVAEIAGTFEIERRFHALFAEQHIRHEWFTWTPELQAVIDAVAAGAFDIATLPEPLRVTHVNGRDNSYSTPGWRYQRSVQSRLWKLRDRGLSQAEAQAANIWNLRCDNASPEELAAIKARVEPIFEGWNARFPTATHQRRNPRLRRAA